LPLGMHAEDEDRQFGFGFFDFAKDLEAAAAGHGDVEHHDVPILLPDAIQRFLRITGFAERRPLEIIREDLFETVPHHGVVVGQEYLHASVWRPRAAPESTR